MQLSLPLVDGPGVDDATSSPIVPEVLPGPTPSASRVTTLETSRSPGDGADPWSITFVRRRRARRYVLRVDGEGIVRVTIPRGGSRREAVDFVARHRTWIERQRQRMRPPSLTAADRAGWRARAEAELPPRLLVLAARHDLQVTRISIRNQRTRWGSCGRNGHITLNWRLILMPEWVA